MIGGGSSFTVITAKKGRDRNFFQGFFYKIDKKKSYDILLFVY